jgi:hypothetical protein
MRDKKSYEYTVVRLVPRIEREEFINIGVVLYAPAQHFLEVKFYLDKNRLESLCPNIDIDELQKYLDSFGRICSGGSNAGPIGTLPPAQRFRWLSATRSTILQMSKVHTGLTDDPVGQLERLYQQLVL